MIQSSGYQHTFFVFAVIYGVIIVAVASFRNHFHVRLLVDDGRKPVTHYRVIIGEHDADLCLHDRRH